MSACMMCGSDRAALQFRQTGRLYGATSILANRLSLKETT